MNDMNNMNKINYDLLIAIDPGSEQSGIVLLVEDKIWKGETMTNEAMFDLIDRHSIFGSGEKLTVAYEDIRPYTSRFNMATINTCKVIGRLEYILKQQRVPFRAITRNEVKSFVFNTYPQLVAPEIMKKIAAKGRTRKDGSSLRPSFIYVDDRIVLKAMKYEWNIETPKPGKTNQYGIKDHAWQALGVATFYLSKIKNL